MSERRAWYIKGGSSSFTVRLSSVADGADPQGSPEGGVRPGPDRSGVEVVLRREAHGVTVL
jgi:hypothetical protein